jgi:hypothetical protein
LDFDIFPCGRTFCGKPKKQEVRLRTEVLACTLLPGSNDKTLFVVVVGKNLEMLFPKKKTDGRRDWTVGFYLGLNVRFPL